MSNCYKIYEAISNIDDDLIADAINAEAPASRSVFPVFAAVAALTAAIVIPSAIIASYRAEPPSVPAEETTLGSPSVKDIETNTELPSVLGAETTEEQEELTFTDEQVEHVPNHEVITIEEIRKTEPYFELLPSKLLKDSVQTSGIRWLYDELTMEEDTVVYPNYSADFYPDPDGVIYETMKEPFAELGIPLDQLFKMHHYKIELSSLSYWPHRFHYITDLNNKEEYDISIHLDPVPEGAIPVEFAKNNESWLRFGAAEHALFLPEQVTVETVKSRIMENGTFSMDIRYGDYFVEYTLWTGPYDDGTYPSPSAEELYEMITSAPCFNK